MREQSTTNNIFQPKHVRGGETKVMKAMKKSILTFLAFALVFTMAMPAFAANVATGATYSDVENADVADAVKVLSSLDVLKGYPDGTFKPDNTITRAEFAAVVVRLLGYEKAAQAAVGPTQFKDEVLPWASGYVNIAVQQNLLTGYPDGTFRANQNVTQAEALTILVRALGYKPLADKQGQWPYNYIVMANYIGLTDALDGVVANQAATRAYVALATKAGLTAPMAVFKGFNYNGEPTYTMSGEDGTSKVTVLEKFLGYNSVTALVTDIPRVNSKLDKDEVQVTINAGKTNEKTELLTVPEGFDFEAAFGAKLNYYADKDNNVVFAKASGLEYDAIEITAATAKDPVKVNLVDADKDYEIADKALIILDGKVKKVADLDTDADYSYAKVAFDDRNDIRFIEAFTVEPFVVEKVDEKEKVVYGYGDELDVDKYTFVKEGKTIQLADLQKNDILFFNTAEKYVEVYNNTVTGDIERVYTTLVRVDGKDYKYASAQYVKDGKLAAFNDEIADQMKDEGAVTLFFDRTGTLVFATGELGETPTTSFYAFLTEALVSDLDARNNPYLYLDFVNPADEVKSYVLKAADVDTNFAVSGKDTYAAAKDVVKVTVDDKGKVTKLETTTNFGTPSAKIKTDDSYVTVGTKTVRLSSSAPVFMVEKYNDTDKTADIEVIKFGDIKDFDTIETTNTVVYHDGKTVKAIVAGSTNLDSDVDTKVVVVKDYAKFKSSSEQYRLTVLDGTTESVLYTEKDKVTATDLTTADYVVATIEVSKKTGDVVKLTVAAAANLPSGTVDGNANTADKKVTLRDSNVGEYQLVPGFAVIDATDKTNLKLTSLRNVKDGQKVTLVRDEANTNFVKYVIITTK